MVEGAHARLWLFRSAYVVIALVLVVARLLPLGQAPGAWPGPDVLLCFTLAWMLRRPDYMAPWLIALIVLAEDLLLMRPPGLWTAVVVLATEFLRSRTAFTRELTFPAEWVLMSGTMIAVALAYRFAFGIAFLPQPPFGFAMMQVVASILCYPFVVWISVMVLKLHKPATGEVDAYGRRM
ncbi:rod shape-determining protein MreD [Falsirhodobacter xinxiangensis]|uniref:rod shape-determining protein MreD n=1 Tax=Falsirhodobacter xinxiangensis TaxID=2530049 RepID=UPI0010AA77CA|nr:rod shape-determining protein MreD [Rhodobacter xinxiangensis]